MSKEALTAYVVAQRAHETQENTGFGLLRDEAKDIQRNGGSRASWTKQLEIDENAFMEENFASDPKAKFKRTGKWKYRTYLPRAYYTAKSALITAWVYGINLDQGKTALEKAVAQIKRGASTAAPSSAPKVRAMSYDARMGRAIRDLDSCFDVKKDHTIDVVKAWLSQAESV